MLDILDGAIERQMDCIPPLRGRVFRPAPAADAKLADITGAAVLLCRVLTARLIRRAAIAMLERWTPLPRRLAEIAMDVEIARMFRGRAPSEESPLACDDAIECARWTLRPSGTSRLRRAASRTADGTSGES